MRLLKEYPLFRKTIINNFISTLGDSMYYIALMTYAAQLDRPDFGIMLVSLSESLPYLFSLMMGSLADMSGQRTKKIIYTGLWRGGLYFLVGILIGFKPSMMILAGITLINFVSDIIGKFDAGLWAPFLPFLVSAEDFEEAQGMKGAINQIVNMMSQFVGAFLLGIFSYRLLAFINSFTFFLTVLIVLTIVSELLQIEKNQMDSSRQQLAFRTIWEQMVSSVKELYHNRILFTQLVLFSLANGLLTVLVPLVSLLFIENTHLLINNFSFSLALFSALMSAGVVAGSLFGSKTFKSMELNTLCFYIFMAIFCVGIGILGANIWVLFIGGVGVGLFVGGASPKLSAAVVRQIPIDKLGSVNGGISTLLMSVPPIATTMFTGLASAKTLNAAVYLLLICSVVFALASLWFGFKRLPQRDARKS
ncbi:hypothetical protein ACWN8V_11960 [Vagococcus elongatus]|uniref:MFS transporter n=1 Tax=Vagococcus elongatus TaxID=180344 RepID=A0A430B3W7_9ENTE|nr:hypothetical protein [Vagococcus elongatus]RSU15046.1 hypothetical protein CBF29_01525 [Vagococcus elongatus]